MAITYSLTRQNDRGIYVEFTGDGTTSALPAIAAPRHFVKPAFTVSARCVKAGTSQHNGGGGTGLLGQKEGTPVSVSSASYSNGSFSVTLGAAAQNAVVHALEITVLTSTE